MGEKIEYFPEKLGNGITAENEEILHFPVMFLYDEFMQSDVVNDFPTNTTFRDQLKVVLKERAPWDETHRYNMDNI